LKVDLIWDEDPDNRTARKSFDQLTALFPKDRLVLETAPNKIEMRAFDLLAPLGKGQRGLIVAPPRAGKTILLEEIANSINKNHPEVYLIVLLIDERPEEVTNMRRAVRGEVVSSTFDEQPERHVQVADMVLEKAKRLVEHKVDVVILLDSITRLARAHNAITKGRKKTMSGGMDSEAIAKARKFFASARNVEEGGSLTVIATALVETGSRMDDLIYEEFKGTGNMEVTLDRGLAEARVFPAFAVDRSGTRNEELLYHPDEYKRICQLRKILAEVPNQEAMELLIKRLKATKTNAEFLLSLGNF
jgi:transcription termination factor Rho